MTQVNREGLKRLALSPIFRWGIVLFVGAVIFYVSVFTPPPEELLEAGNSVVDTSTSTAEPSSQRDTGVQQSTSSNQQTTLSAVILPFVRANYVHISSYATFGLTLSYAMSVWDYRWWQIMLLVVGVSTGYGIVLEVVQLSVPARDLQTVDMFANTIGAGSAALLYGGIVGLLRAWRWMSTVLGNSG